MTSTAEDLVARLADAQAALVTLQADRDYWRRQHDLVMADWKADCAQFEAERAQVAPAAPPAGVPQHDAALLTLLRFYDPTMGAVHGQRDGVFLFYAFARAYADIRSG